MSTITNKELKENIKDSLGLGVSDSSPTLNEAYVIQEKSFKLPTEMLSSKNKRNHIEIYDQNVKDFNRISAELDVADRSAASSDHSEYRSLKLDETYNLNGSYLHELYFANISDLHSEISMDSLTFMRLERDFGTFDDWQQDFIACTLSSRCGWAITGFNLYLQRYVNCMVDLHSLNVPVGIYPVIVMDAWQHAYYRDYLKDVKTYTYAMMKELNWEVIENRFKKAERLAKALRD